MPPGARRRWWEREDVVKECGEFGTVWECGSLFAFKE